jgi:hypothetical protein
MDRNVLQIAPAAGWYAVYLDAETDDDRGEVVYQPLACWALTGEGGVVGVIADQDSETWFAGNVTYSPRGGSYYGFVEYVHESTTSTAEKRAAFEKPLRERLARDIAEARAADGP